MKRRFLVFALALVAVCLFALTPQKAEAATIVDSGTCGDNLTWTLDDEGTLTISGSGAMRNYDWSYYAPWYSNRSSIKKVVFGDSVTSIGSYAFYNCDSLTSITIPDSVTSVGRSAFYKCTSLTSITIPDSVTSIGDDAFYKCTSLTSITIPDSVTSIGSYAFYDCDSLTSVTITDSVTSIGNSAFEYCYSLTDVYITDPSAWCKISFGNSYASPMYYGGKLHILGADGKEVREVILDDSITSIPNYAFKGYASLASITIPDSVNSIGKSAFSGCTRLTSITIPDSVTSVGGYAFEGCARLASVYVSDIETWCGVVFGNYNANPLSNGGKLYIDGQLATNITIPEGVTDRVYFTFAGCTSLTSIAIPDSVTSIGDDAFYKCTSLTSIKIPDSVTSIGDSAFRNCDSLTSITIPDSVTSIGNSAFYNCDSLTSITIPDSVTSIDSWVFSDCDSLTSITIPDSVTSIDDSAFRECSSLTNVTIGNGVTSIGEYAFYYCNRLKVVTILGELDTVQSDAFYNCYSLWHVMFAGDEADWDWIVFEGGNDCLKNATRHLNCTGKEKLDIANEQCCICNGGCVDKTADGFCDLCGAKVEGANIDVSKVKFATTGLSLGEFIGMQSAIMKNTMNGGKFDEAYFVYNQYTTGANGQLELVATVRGEYIDAGTFFVSECPVNAKQMSDVFEITPYFVVKGVTSHGTPTTTSVKAEVMKLLAKSTTDDKTKALCVAMLNYGAEAQKKFGYNLSNLANSDLSTSEKVLPKFDSLNLQKSNFIPEIPGKPISSGLSLGDVVYMQFLVKMSDVDANGTVKYRAAGGTVVETAVANLETYGSYYVINISVKAKDVRSNITINFFDADGMVNYLMTCSVEAFAKTLQGTANENLVAALMAYGDAAKAVFG